MRLLKLLPMAVLPLTLSSGCAEPKRIVAAVNPPLERLECKATIARPTIPAEHTPATETEKYVSSIRARELVIVNYVMGLEADLFRCTDNAAWLRQWYAGMPDKD